jgi:Transposase DDE domain
VIDKSTRENGTFSRSDFTFDHATDLYRCPGGKVLTRNRRTFAVPRDVPLPDDTYRYRASKSDCDACDLKSRCCPNTPARKVTRSIYEGARDFARDIAKTDAYVTSRRQRKKVEMLFAHLKRILRLGRLRLRGPAAHATSSCSQQPLRTSESSPSSGPWQCLHSFRRHTSPLTALSDAGPRRTPRPNASQSQTKSTISARGSHSAMSALRGGFNRSRQHTQRTSPLVFDRARSFSVAR